MGLVTLQNDPTAPTRVTGAYSGKEYSVVSLVYTIIPEVTLTEGTTSSNSPLKISSEEERVHSPVQVSPTLALTWKVRSSEREETEGTWMSLHVVLIIVSVAPLMAGKVVGGMGIVRESIQQLNPGHCAFAPFKINRKDMQTKICLKFQQRKQCYLVVIQIIQIKFITRTSRKLLTA